MPVETATKPKSGVIRLIAIFKLLKAISLIAVGIGALHLIHKDVAEIVDHWVALLGLDPGGRRVERVLEMAGNLRPHRLEELGAVSFLYAALFLTEGIGLWLMKRWAEWFTVVITGSLVPLELYELFRHPTFVKGGLLAINVGVVVYLVMRIRREDRERE